VELRGQDVSLESPGQQMEDIVLGGWVRGDNPRRHNDYDLYAYNCWVSGLQ